MRLAILSHVVPPMFSGQATVLGRLSQAFERGEILFIASFRACNARALIEQEGRFRTCFLARDLPHRFAKPALFLGLLMRAQRVASVVRQEACNSIVACSGEILDLPAGFLASRLARIPFYAYLFDDYVYQWQSRFYRLFARRIELLILKQAKGVIVPNEFLRDEYSGRYGISCTIVRNPHPYPDSILSQEVPKATAKDGVEIVYSGAVYHVNYDAFHCLLKAIASLDCRTLRLHLYTAASEESLRSNGIISSDAILHGHLSPAEILTVQQQADILYLPLGFNSPVPKLVRTSAPGKMGEYLAAGRPILVHAPPDSFVSWYFKEHNCGLVVDVNESSVLADAIELLVDDKSLQERLVANARVCAREDFGLAVAQNQFRRLVGGASVAGA